ncbi:GNAT family N-acetyltransferase [Streptomyces sp. bgisy100]|uniref:GNAT family N-acetyltransferase n=1 Tax=Streptomyces sp. bgisy100 TaxID=3413783 RepID=UPI003D744B75
MEFTTGGRPAVSITAADVGKRVSVRRLADPGTGSGIGGGRFTDTVGVLDSWEDGVLCVTRRTGETVRIAESGLVAGKVVPAAPAARRGAVRAGEAGPARHRGPAATWQELTRTAARAWPPVESERLGEWELRRAAGFTRRANSVLALGDPGMPLDAALRRVTDWYAARGGTAYVQLSTGVPGAQEELAAELAARGWVREVSALIRTAPLARLADAEPSTPVRLSRSVDDAWLGRYQRSARPTPEALAVLQGGPSVHFATVPGAEGAPPAAIGRCAVDGRWAGFAAVEVDPELRRQGLASAVMTALARRALDDGASAAYLQVEAENDEARALYDGLGFRTHHTYEHWRAPEGSPR